MVGSQSTKHVLLGSLVLSLYKISLFSLQRIWVKIKMAPEKKKNTVEAGALLWSKTAFFTHLLLISKLKTKATIHQ